MKTLCSLLLFLYTILPLKGQQQLYVSLTGNDNNPGTIAAPLASMEGARDKIRVIKSTVGLPTGGVEVIIREGIYERVGSFELTSQDEGAQNAPIVYKAYAGEDVTLSAGKRIDATNWKPLSVQAAARVHPLIGIGQLYELDYDTLGIQNGDFLNVNSQSTSGPTSFSLFADDIRQELSRWPNENDDVTSYNDPGWSTPNGTRDNYSFYFGAGGQPTDGDATNELDLDGTNRSARWKARLDAGNDLWLRGHWRTPWAPRLSLVDDINLAEEWIKLTDIPSGGMGSKYTGTFTSYDGNDYRTGSGRESYYALNMLEEIDQPGEYAIDFKDRRVYYFPANNLNSLDIRIMDNGESLVVVDSADYVHFENITFKGGIGSGIVATHCSHLMISGCVIDAVGNVGIQVNGGSDQIIQCNDIFQTGSTGLVVQNVGDRSTLTSSNMLVTNNHIHNIGQLNLGAVGIFTNKVVGITFSHNLIHHAPSAGIVHFADNNCIFEYNEIHNCALKTSDTGATYGTLHWDSYGNIFRYNFVHHNRRANGFYCDDGNSGDFHYKNIIHNCIDALKFGGGHDNIAENNLLISNGQQRIDDRGVSRGYTIGSAWEARLLAMNPLQEPWLSYGIQLKNDHNLTTNLWSDVLDANWKPEYPNGCRYQDNVTVESDNWKLPGVGNVIFQNNEEVGPIASAGFYDYSNMDLRTNNPTILSKFPELNTEFPKMGLIVSGCRPAVPSRDSVGGLENAGAANTEGEDDLIERTIVADLNKTEYQYDFGPSNSPTPNEWKLVRPDVIGSLYWTGDARKGEDQGGNLNIDSLKQDFIRGDGTSQLNIKIANGIWKVEMVMGEQNTNHWGMRVKAEGDYIAYNVATAAGEFKYLDGAAGSTSPSSVDITVSDGELNLEIYANASRHWAINHLKLTRVATEMIVNPIKRSYQYDFGAIDSETEEGWTVLSPLDYGDVYWTGDTLTTEDQGVAAGIDNLKRDFIHAQGTVNFNHKVSNGIWRVELVMGEQNLNHWGMIVGAEGATLTYNIATAAGEFKYVGLGTSSVTPNYFEVPVTDGELNIMLRVQASRPWIANHIKLTKIADDITVDTNKMEYKYDFGSFDSETQSGWQIITPDDYGDINWTGATLTTQDLGLATGVTDLTRDFVTAPGSVQFNHKIANGKWRIEMVMGESAANHWGMRVKAEGNYIVYDMATAAGEFKYVDGGSGSISLASVDVIVSDGELNLEIYANASRPWVANHLKLTKVGEQVTVDTTALSYQYDFGPFQSDTEQGWTVISPDDFGDVFWTGNTLTADDQKLGAGISNLTRDLVRSNDAITFNHKIANGPWRIELVMGEKNTNHWGMRAKAEGNYIVNNMATNAGQFKYVDGVSGSISPASVDVIVNDGELNLELSVNASRPWVANHIKLTKLLDSDGDGVYDYEDICNGADDNLLLTSIQLNAWLEGTYDPTLGEMTNILNIQHQLLPGQTPVNILVSPTPPGQPYNTIPWAYAGTEGTNWTDADYTANDLDWVLVSFRTGTGKNTEIARVAALLQKDGSIRFVDPCSLPSSDSGPLYIVIEHRNHIGIMTPQPVDIINRTLMYDFRISDSYKDGAGYGQKQLPTGEWVMFAGDGDQTDFPGYDINGTDKAFWLIDNGIFQKYLISDYNLDGDINGADKVLWSINNGIFSKVPK